MWSIKRKKRKHKREMSSSVIDSTKFNVIIATSRPFSWFDELKTTYPAIHWVQLLSTIPEQEAIIQQLQIIGNYVVRYYQPGIQLCGTLSGPNIPKSKIISDLQARHAI
jgi:hypothetical protein